MEANTPDPDTSWMNEPLSPAERKAIQDAWYHCLISGDVVTGNHVSVSSNVHEVVQHLVENGNEWEGRTVDQMPSTCLKYKSIYNKIAYLTKAPDQRKSDPPHSDQASFQGGQPPEDPPEDSSLLVAGTRLPTGTQTPIFS